MAWWVKYMARHQRVQIRLRQDLHQTHAVAFDEKRWPTIDEITAASVPYLDAVIEETTRFAAVAPFTLRTTLCDTQILGYPVPKGVNVLLALTGPSLTEPPVPVLEHTRTTACQKDRERVPAWGDDLGEYVPERWLRRNIDASGNHTDVFCPNSGPNLAFSSGPRQCFGRRQAVLQMKVLATLLMWEFEFGDLKEDLNGDESVAKLMNSPRDSYVKLRALRR